MIPDTIKTLQMDSIDVELWYHDQFKWMFTLIYHSYCLSLGWSFLFKFYTASQKVICYTYSELLAIVATMDELLIPIPDN